MAAIFIGGSRVIVELPQVVIASIDKMVAAEHDILIGDAPGADAQLQRLLADHGYGNVRVFHAGKAPRSNLGEWATCYIEPDETARGFAVQAGKDREMARRADFGLMVWDGKSPGTALNVMRLALIGSPCVVHDLARSTVTAIRDKAGWLGMIGDAGPTVYQQAEVRMTRDERILLGL